MRIAVDAMGGDHAPREVVLGAAQAVRERGVDVVLVGRNGAVESELKGLDLNLPIINANEVVGFDEAPTKAVRSKRDSSIVVGVKLVKEGQVSAFVSAGNSGAVMTAALLTLGSVEGIDRPALGFLFPPPWPQVLFLDVGANVDCRPGQILQFARMGSAYMERLFRIERPRIGLLSNGEESGKGNRLVREGHRLLKESGLNFVGNVEGRDIVTGVVDVVVTDGFTGNVVLKANEGMSEYMLLSLRQKLASRLYFRIAAFFLEPALRSFTRKLEYSEYGGAPLLGVNGNVVVAHGRSDATAIKNAVFIAQEAAKRGVVEAVRLGMGTK